ncbi:MAG TPA: hypothetical protein VH163_06665 [Gemmatimonadales bacterium]|jgi:hypothetical protein|nr:hypothetical protein [Gemmatimonadales bacterium]
MTSPKVLMEGRGKAALAANPEQAWRALAWLGGLLAVVGLGDFVLAFIPLGSGPEWEFGTVASVFAGLPLPTLGLAAILGAAYARGKRGTVVAIGVLLLLLALAVGWMLVTFLTDIPIALKSGAQAEVMLGLKKAMVKTALLGGLFGLAYVVAGIKALRAGLK